MSRSRPRSTGFLEELKRRKVLQAAAGYAIVAWVLLQIGEVTFDPLGIPDWVMAALIVLVVIGFPIVIIVAWFFDLTLKGFIKDGSAAPLAQGQRRPDQATTDSGAGADGRSGPSSVAVLPFDDMSPAQDQAYLCDGIAEEILNRLAQIRNLRVASRTSSFRFKGLSKDVRSIGEQLEVATVLEGSVRKADNQLRITTQLINVADGFHLWSQSYDRELERIFEIEDEIAANVAEALEVALGARPDEQCCSTDNIEAYEFYLRGMHYFHRWGLRNVTFATEMFSKAVAADPGYARAWAALADSHAMTCMYWDPSDEHLQAADEASEKALELLPGLAEAHVSRGLSHFVRRADVAAIAEFETALRLSPDLFEAHYFYGRIRFQRGELDRAAELFEKAERISQDDFQASILLRQVYHSLGRHDEAIAAARRGVERAERHLEFNPDDTRALNLGLAGLAETGEKEKAIRYAERSLELDGENPDTLYNVACGFALIGEPDRALDCLERASLRGTRIAEWAENDADLASLHDHPRFQALMEELTHRQPEAP